MKINGKPSRSLWYNHDTGALDFIDQRFLPHEVVIGSAQSLDAFATAITEMRVRGAPLIGATAAFGIACQMARDPSNTSLDDACRTLMATRPTAVNLRWALDHCRETLRCCAAAHRARDALEIAQAICDQDVERNRMIGIHGLEIIKRHAAQITDGRPINILTHCHAGAIATVDWGTATSPIYQAHDAGIPLHIWVDETRPRNQGAITAWELGSHGVPHSYVTDNAGGHLMQRGQVDMVIVGTDRTTRTGDVCNKIGTYLKALAARAHDIPFYVALPSPTIDWEIADGLHEIPIEDRAAREITHVIGRTGDGVICEIELTPPGTKTANPAFDVTPANLVTGLITERGLTEASAEGLQTLFPEHAKQIQPSQ